MTKNNKKMKQLFNGGQNGLVSISLGYGLED